MDKNYIKKLKKRYRFETMESLETEANSENPTSLTFIVIYETFQDSKLAINKAIDLWHERIEKFDKIKMEIKLLNGLQIKFYLVYPGEHFYGLDPLITRFVIGKTY